MGHAARTLTRRLALARRGGALLVALCVLAWAPRAAAFPSTRLVYARGPGAEQCPDQAAVRKAVATRLGYDPFFPSSDKTIVARVLRERDLLKGQVELIDERGAQVGLREFSAEPEKCDDLIRAMALSISIAIDPKSAETYSQGPPDEPDTAPSNEPPAAPPAPEPSRVQEPRPARPSSSLGERSSARVRPSFGLALLGSLGTAPKLNPGAAVFGALRFQAWSIALEGRADLPVERQEGGVPLRTSTWAVNAVPCFHLGVGFACAVGSLRWLSATRTDGGAKDGSRPFWAFGGRLGAEWPIGARLSLLGYLDLTASPAAPEVRPGSDAQAAWKPTFFSGDLAIAAALHF